jgi:hypothetical protein
MDRLPSWQRDLVWFGPVGHHQPAAGFCLITGIWFQIVHAFTRNEEFTQPVVATTSDQTLLAT